MAEQRPFMIRVKRTIEQFQDIEVWAAGPAEAQDKADTIKETLDWPDADLADDDLEVEYVKPKEE